MHLVKYSNPHYRCFDERWSYASGFGEKGESPKDSVHCVAVGDGGIADSAFLRVPLDFADCANREGWVY